MDHEAFDALVVRLGTTRRRRAAIGLLAGAPIALGLGGIVAPALETPGAAAKKPRRVRGEHNVRGKKAIMCVDGVTKRVPKKKRKAYLKQGATRGACPAAPTTTCAPVCPTGDTCGMADGCGGTCGCGASAFCSEGVCLACDVACTGNATACGDSLRARLPLGGTIQLCPGTYGGLFAISVVGTTLIGAGNGADPVTSSILDAQQTGTTLAIATAMNATVTNLRITGGSAAAGGGIFVTTGTFGEPSNTLTDCVVTGNTATGDGGGIHSLTQFAMTNCEVTNNTAGGSGGGIYAGQFSNAVFTIDTSLISENTAVATGGGIYFGGQSSMDVTSTVVDDNTADDGGGLHNTNSGPGRYLAVDANSSITNNTALNITPLAGGFLNTGEDAFATGATVSGNTSPQCYFVSGC
ncbi:MAG: hypothetical protein QM692_18050 [Thermomicrobiales bacterium]